MSHYGSFITYCYSSCFEYECNMIVVFNIPLTHFSYKKKLVDSFTGIGYTFLLSVCTIIWFTMNHDNIEIYIHTTYIDWPVFSTCIGMIYSIWRQCMFHGAIAVSYNSYIVIKQLFIHSWCNTFYSPESWLSN